MPHPGSVEIHRKSHSTGPLRSEDLHDQAAMLAETVQCFLLENTEPGETHEVWQEVLDAIKRAMRRAGSPLTVGDPMLMMTAAQLGRTLNGLGEDMVRIREREGALFSVLPFGRSRGRLYPAFQAWEGIAGARLAQVLVCLRGLDGDSIREFFAQRSSDLEGLTPVEMLYGKVLNDRSVSDVATAALERGSSVRLGRAIAAATAYFEKNT